MLPCQSSASPLSSHSTHTQSPSLSRALSPAGSIVTPQRGQIGGRSSSTGAVSAKRRADSGEPVRLEAVSLLARPLREQFQLLPVETRVDGDDLEQRQPE